MDFDSPTAACECPGRLLGNRLLPRDCFIGHGSLVLGDVFPAFPQGQAWFPFAQDPYHGNGTAEALPPAYVDGPQEYTLDSRCESQAYPLDICRFPLETHCRSWHPPQPQLELPPLGTHTPVITSGPRLAPDLDFDLSLLPDDPFAGDVYASHLDEPLVPSDHPDSNQYGDHSYEGSITDSSSPFKWQPSSEASAPPTLPNLWTPSGTTGDDPDSFDCGSLSPPNPLWFGSPPPSRHDLIAGTGSWTQEHLDAHAVDTNDYQAAWRHCEEAASSTTSPSETPALEVATSHHGSASPNTAHAQETTPTERRPLDTTTSATTTPKPHPCAHCPKTFPTRSTLRRHIEKTTKPHACPHPPCSFRGASPRDVKRHLKSRKHANSGASAPPAERFHCSARTCRFADEGFARFDNYQRHMRTRHGIHVAILGGRVRKEAREGGGASGKTLGGQDADEQD